MVKIFLKPSLHKAKSQASKTYNEATLFPILTTDKLLPEIEKNHYFNKLQEYVMIPDDYFKLIYESLIDNFAQLVQVLPETYGEELGGLLNDGLRRALLSLQILHETHESRPHPLYVFAIFSIALLSDVGEVFRYQVMISDEQGAYLDDWYPNLGPMIEFGDYYKLRPYGNTPQSLVQAVTPLLARQLLSDTSITWLSSNNQIFDMWLAFLHKGDDWAGGLLKVLKIDPKQFEARMGEIELFPVEIKTYEGVGTELGEKFLEWLKAGLQDGSISYNEVDSKVHLVKMNELDLSVFLQAPELFQQFCNVYIKTRDWVVVCQQFNALGLTELSGYDFKIKQFFSDSGETKSMKLNFLAKDKKGIEKRHMMSEQGKLTSRMISAANSIKEGVVVKNAKTLFESKALTASPYLRDIEMRWKTDNLLPKIRTNQAPTISLPVKPQSGIKV